MNPIDLKTARKLIDFSGGSKTLNTLSEMQIKGAVALQNMIADPEIGFAYLADEVGMGKTYIALGVVAMLRYFDPTLRVLYICPSRNVQEKWEREYKSFVRVNLRFSHGRQRTLDGKSAVPYASCRSVDELLRYAGSGYIADYFIGKDSFSISLKEDESEWKKRLNQVRRYVPALEFERIESKGHAKEQFAKALNYVLPTFDLVVIDEAHNFKHNFESSYRNQVLSRVLGVREDAQETPRVKHALLISATPYDRDLAQLRNQMKLIGRSELLPEDVQGRDDSAQKTIRRFMVRRLNVLPVNGERLTRNMYRREWRKGVQAEIDLEKDEQKLVTALVQKKVGEVLSRQTESPAFQVGLLASFESFAESAQSGPVEFDGEVQDRQQSDSKDRHVVARISDGYKHCGLGRTLPHPKMDIVVQRLSESMFGQARKQLVFVRRVKSVSEIKNKLDDAYNDWIWKHICRVLGDHQDLRKMMQTIYDRYCEVSGNRDQDVIGGEITIQGGEASLPAKNDTFFAWFFRGETAKEFPFQLATVLPAPDSVRTGLAAKSQTSAILLEPNWALYLCRKENLSLEELIDVHGKELAAEAGRYISGDLQEDKLEVFHACQIALIKCMIEKAGTDWLRPLLAHLRQGYAAESSKVISQGDVHDYLTTSTLFTELDRAGLGAALIPQQSELYAVLKEKGPADKLLKDFDIHKALLSLLLRTSHGIIDLYLARLKQGDKNLTDASRRQWMRDFVDILRSQALESGFSTFIELKQLAENFELIKKNNIPQVLELTRDEYPRYLGQTLSPVSPVIGASGATSGRSAQARKFRMPGYPLALVSTDVFQEGEDLHMFCDSVMHYGLSNTPVGLEQKVGRVDRVNSKAQRRLTELSRSAGDDDLIQVTYPFVKKSIEALQIRHICRNYNQFICSLHDFVDNTSANDTICMDVCLASKEDIPEQIREFLESPFEPQVAEQNNHCAVADIETNEVNLEKHKDAICGAVSELLQDRSIKPPADNRLYVEGDGFQIKESNLTIKLTSARASGELILSLTQPSIPATAKIQNLKELSRHMDELSWRTFYRTYAIENSDSSYKIFSNAEILIRDANSLHEKISRFLQRMEISHDPIDYQIELSPEIASYVRSIHDNTTIPYDRSEQTRMRAHMEADVTRLDFEFGGPQTHRIQRVSVYLSKDKQRCIFLSKATDWEAINKMHVKDLVKYTWMRNRNIDLVEFMLNPDFQIIGRIVHPLVDMLEEEFIYCAYTLAVETDRLEYLLQLPDRH